MEYKTTLHLVTLLLSQHAVVSASSCINCDGGNVTCVEGDCLPRCVIVTSSGECFQCRDSRFYGKQCENVCPQTCLNSHCHLDNSRVICTEGCVAGKKGDTCEVDCSAGCTQCERYGDICTGDCSNPQYYGDLCDQTCPDNCRGGCSFVNSILMCTDGCVEGKRGDNCEVDCPASCTECDRYSQRCIGPCSNPKYYGNQCEKTCPRKCTGSCDRDTGRCDSCLAGYTGSYCNCSRCTECDRDCVIKNDETGVFYIGMVVCVTLAVIICLGLVLIWIRRKRKKSLKYRLVIPSLPRENEGHRRRRENYTEEWDFDNTIYSGPSGIRPKPRVLLCTDLKGEQSDYHIKKEFKALPKPEVQSSHCGRLSENSLKNRYKDIVPFDGTRVCLTVEEDGDESNYINASYIDGYKQRTQYIAAQGPIKAIMEDFWKMIWQGEVTKIVMLTNLVEEDIVKCEMYWPDCGTDLCTYGDVSVQCVEEKVFEHYTVRSLAVWKVNCKTRIIMQFHYTSWPAHGVPQEVTSLIEFYKVAKNTSSEKEDGPTLVHCSAGVGRTGTFLALVSLIEQARYEGRASVYNCVHDIRFQRMKMVHTEEQYLFLYRVLTAAIQTTGILQDNSTVTLQCRQCWEKDKQRPVINGVFMAHNHVDRNQSSTTSV